MLTVAEAHFAEKPPPPAAGDRLETGGTVYRVSDPQPDGSGLIRLVLGREWDVPSYRGKDGVLQIGSPLAPVGNLQNWNLDETTDTVAGWGMGDTYETTFTTVRRWTGSAEVYLGDADPTGDLVVGAEIALELYPGGMTSGSGCFSGTAMVTGLNRAGNKAGIPSLTVNFLGSGALTPATVV